MPQGGHLSANSGEGMGKPWGGLARGLAALGSWEPWETRILGAWKLRPGEPTPKRGHPASDNLTIREESDRTLKKYLILLFTEIQLQATRWNPIELF